MSKKYTILISLLLIITLSSINFHEISYGAEEHVHSEDEHLGDNITHSDEDHSHAAEELVGESGYEPWFSMDWGIHNSDLSTFFSYIPVAIGTFIIGYFLGQWRKTDKKK